MIYGYIGIFLGFLVIAGMVLSIATILASDGCLGRNLQLTLGHNRVYNKCTDLRVNGVLDDLYTGKVKITGYGCYTIKLGNPSSVVGEIWINNKYYGYGTFYGIAGKAEGRPSLTTMKRIIQLEEALEELGVEEFNKRYCGGKCNGE